MSLAQIVPILPYAAYQQAHCATFFSWFGALSIRRLLPAWIEIAIERLDLSNFSAIFHIIVNIIL